jgi:transposase-like protein
MKKCPKCKSENITLHAAGHTGQYLCKDCGYTGSLILEEDL